MAPSLVGARGVRSPSLPLPRALMPPPLQSNAALRACPRAVTDDVHKQAFAMLMAPHGLDITDEYFHTHIHGRSNQELFEALFPHIADPAAQARLAEEKEVLFRRLISEEGVQGTPGLDKVLSLARSRGVAVAVVTNAPRENTYFILSALGLRDTFGVVVLGQECAAPKPHPEPYLAAMRALGVQAKNCVVFEDSPSGIAAGTASGAGLVVGVRSQRDHAALVSAGAHDSVDTFEEAVPLLERFLEARCSVTPT